MKSESQFPSRLMDFIWQYGAIKVLMSDNTKAENSKVVQDILHQYMIMDANSKPKYQNQNLAKHHIQDVKNMTTTMMDRTGTPAGKINTCRCINLRQALVSTCNTSVRFSSYYSLGLI